MPTSLQTGRSPDAPNVMAETSNGDVIITNGIDQMKRWDGLTASLENAGIAAPTTALTIAASGTGSITGTYYAYVRFLDDEGVYSSFSPISSSVSASSDAQIDYTSVPTSSDSRVTKREIYRNANGNTEAYYLDVTISDNVTTTGTSTRSDANLILQQQVFDTIDGVVSDGNLHDPPPSSAMALASYLDRMWYFGIRSVPCQVQVTNANTSVAGIGTNFTSKMAGWYLYVRGQSRSYEIASVSGQTLTLTENYAGSTDKFAVAAVRPAPSQEDLVYFSEAGLPESVYYDTATDTGNALRMQSDQDRITGGFAMHGYLYITKRRRIYRLSCDSCSPLNSAAIFPVASRGMCCPRAYAVVGDVAYVLDYEGVYKFGSGGAQDVSVSIQDVFREQINWRRVEWFHAAHDRTRGIVRFYVCLDGSKYPRHALVYSYRHDAWEIEEYYETIGGADEAIVAGPMKVLAGGEHAKIMTHDEQGLELVEAGTLRGTVASASINSVTVTGAEFHSTAVGSHVTIVSGRGKGQWNRIVAVESSTTLRFKWEWDVEPDTTSVIVVGAIGWRWKSGMYRYARIQEENSRKVRVHFMPTASDAEFDIRIYQNWDVSPDVMEQDTYQQSDVITTTRGSSDIVVETKSARDYGTHPGVAWISLDSSMEDDANVDRFRTVEFRGWKGPDDMRVNGMAIEGVTTG